MRLETSKPQRERHREYLMNQIGYMLPVQSEDTIIEEIIDFLMVDQDFVVDDVKGGLIVTSFMFDEPNEVSGHLSIWFDDY